MIKISRSNKNIFIKCQEYNVLYKNRDKRYYSLSKLQQIACKFTACKCVYRCFYEAYLGFEKGFFI